MAVKNLSDLYIHELKDLYSADKQSAAITKRLVKAAKNDKLKSALQDSHDGIESGMSTLKDICERHDKKATGMVCKGMKGLVEEVKAHVFDDEFSDAHVKDASIIAQNQRMTHYAIAGYGTAAAFAKALGHKEDHEALKKCLDGCYDGDRRMTDIAESTINESATD